MTAVRLSMRTLFAYVQTHSWHGFLVLTVAGCLLGGVWHAMAAPVTVSNSASTNAPSHLHSGPQTVFIDDQIGYRFLVDSAGECSYVKSTDGGGSWGALVKVDDQGTQNDCVSIAVHYDQWTPGDAGTSIHIVTMDTASDDLFYNRLNTSNDSLLSGSTAVNITQPAGYAGTLDAGSNFPSLTKGSDGTLFAAVDDASDSMVVRCSASCETGSNWSEAGTSPQDLVNDWSLLVPLTDGDIMLINRDLSANVVRSRIWDAGSSTWSGSWVTIDGSAPENFQYDTGMSAVVSASGVVSLAYIAENDVFGSNDDIRTARYSGGTWTSMTDVVTDSSLGLTQVALGMDANNDDVYVAYTGRTTPGTAGSANVYWQSSSNDMSSWSSVAGPVNSSSGDLIGVDINNDSDERLFVSWYDGAGNIDGDTIADVYGGVSASSTGVQLGSVRAGETSIHIGGAFVLVENITTRSVTSVTVSETGTADATTDLQSTALYYEFDTSAPLDCSGESYDGTELQYGTAETFSGANGSATFSDAGVTIGTSSALCLYPVVTISESATNDVSLEFEITDPSTDVVVSDGGVVIPGTAVAIDGSTTIVDPVLTQTHFHFRNDDGDESGASSRTAGVEDIALDALPKNDPFRLRVSVSNEGATTSKATTIQLEYAQAAGSCAETGGWSVVETGSGDIRLHDSANLSNGSDTTDIAVGLGGVTNENTTFLTPNGGVLDTSAQTGSMDIGTSNFVELEYSLIASAEVVQGTSYCLRLTDSGTALRSYSIYPEVTIDADVRVSALGTMISDVNIPSIDQYLGGAFVVEESTATRTVSTIIITETGTVDARSGVENVRLLYEYDTAAPYDCEGVSFNGTEVQYGDTVAEGFNSQNGFVTFTDTATISPVQTLCLYPVLDITSDALNGDTLAFRITDPSQDVSVSGGATVSPSSAVSIDGSTILNGAVLTQTAYHFRNDDGTEAGATSATNGTANTALTGAVPEDVVRLRAQVSNEGATSSQPTAFRLEYGTRVTSCENVGTWIPVGSANAAFSLYDSAFLTQGENTTNIAVADGGMADSNTTFLTPNSAVNDTASTSASVVLEETEFIELEYSIQVTSLAGYDTTYCFRVSDSGDAIQSYERYPELSLDTKRDFYIQRGSVFVSGTSTTLEAGVDYEVPDSASSAFIRITNAHHTGAGRSSAGGNQNADDVTVFLENPENILDSVTLTRPATAESDTRVDWEIVEYIGATEGDNELVVRSHDTVTFGSASNSVTGDSVAGVVDDTKVVVFVTGILSPDIDRTDYETLQVTSEWNADTDRPVFSRGASGDDAVSVSYAVVEFTGVNWNVQRVEHSYAVAGEPETESITPVNALNRTFLHTQKRMSSGEQATGDFGHEVYLSSIGAITFMLDASVSSPSGHTSVAWVIENTQTTVGAMEVHRITGTTQNGTEPLTLSVGIGDTLPELSEASIFALTSVDGTGTNFPRPLAGFSLASTTAFELWRSDTGEMLTYHVEVVDWPTAELSFRQNYYRLYTDNDAITPDDPWPVGESDVGENSAVTVNDEPLSQGDRIRIRMNVKVVNATMPDNTQRFKLQYAERATTCGAISEWTDLGSPGSGAAWRGYDATPVDGEALPSTLLSVSDISGTYEEANDTALNPQSAAIGDDVEFDWLIEQNGAVQRTNYCFRMVFADGTPLSDYIHYPTIRSSVFTPQVSMWRWYSDVNNETPTSPLAAENVSPSNIDDEQDLKLRVSVAEIENASGANVKFALQYSVNANFSDGGTILDPSASCTATSTWCYADHAGIDNAVIQEALLSDAAACSGGSGAGCGTHNETASTSSTHTHPALTTQEYEFALSQRATNVNTVYYFRLYDVVNNEPLSASSSYPSLTTSAGQLDFLVQGLPAGTTTEGVVTGASTSPSALLFSISEFDTVTYSAHRLDVETNAPGGYQVVLISDQLLSSELGDTIQPILGTNASPMGWEEGCSSDANSCFGYHAGDDILFDGSTRFAPDDSYAAVSTTTAEEIMYRASPGADSHDIVYALSVDENVPPGDYQASVMYILIPVY